MAKPNIIWFNVFLFSITGAIALIGVPWYGMKYGYDLFHIIATILCIGYCGMSITAGYHRLWSHNAYNTNSFVRLVYAIGGAFALQNSALHWSSDHRIHHRHVDNNDKDPYSAKRGFFYSHIGWMLREYQASRYTDYSNVKNLQKDKIVMWQHRNYLSLAIATNLGIPLALGMIHGDIIGMLLTVGVLRLVISHHVTFFINSLAHVWGRQPYTDENTARDNGVIAYLTFGEGYHNYHHCFQFDYRNGIKWYQFDPTKWFIFSLEKFGMASKLRRCSDERIEKAMASMSLKRATAAATSLPDAEEIKRKLQKEYEILVSMLNELVAAQKAWLEEKKRLMIKNYEQSEAYQAYQDMKGRFTEQQDKWRLLVAQYA